MGSPANSSSLITSNQNPLLLPLSACSQLLLLRLSPRLMPMLSMATMAMDTIWDMPTMDTMDTPMPTVETSMARDLLMLTTDTTDMLTTHTPMDTITDTLTMVTTDTHTDMPTGVKMCSRIED